MNLMCTQQWSICKEMKNSEYHRLRNDDGVVANIFDACLVVLTRTNFEVC